MIHELLCLLGIHHWIEYDDYFTKKISCSVCHKIKFSNKIRRSKK